MIFAPNPQKENLWWKSIKNELKRLKGTQNTHRMVERNQGKLIHHIFLQSHMTALARYLQSLFMKYEINWLRRWEVSTKCEFYLTTIIVGKLWTASISSSCGILTLTTGPLPTVEVVSVLVDREWGGWGRTIPHFNLKRKIYQSLVSYVEQKRTHLGKAGGK